MIARNKKLGLFIINPKKSATSFFCIYISFLLNEDGPFEKIRMFDLYAVKKDLR